MTPGVTTTSGITRSNRTNKAPIGAIIGGVLGGLALLALIVGVISCIRRRRRHIAGISERNEGVSPYAIPRPDSDMIDSSKSEDAGGGLMTSTLEFTSAGDRNTRNSLVGFLTATASIIGKRQLYTRNPPMGTGSRLRESYQSQQPDRDTNRPGHDAEAALEASSPTSPLAQIMGDMQQELEGLRTEVRQLRDARQGSPLAHGEDTIVSPPVYSPV
jgi:hypothetical protein